jgi:uncharacterized repeat protein (TIGR01451 family)
LRGYGIKSSFIMKHFLTALFFCCISHSLFAQMNWQRSNGPQGGAVGNIFNNEDYAFYPDQYSLYRTNDGAHWERLDMPNLWAASTAGAKVVAMQGQPYGLLKRRLLVSHDNGDTWAEGTLPSKANYMGLVSTSDKIFIPSDNLTPAVIFQSEDDGLSWDTIAAPEMYIYDLWTYDDRLYVSTSSRLWKLDLDGTTWQKITLDMPPQNYIAAVFAEDSLLCVSTPMNLFVSSDYGQTWLSHETDYNNSGQGFAKLGNRIYKDGPAKDYLLYTDNLGQSWQTYPLTADYSFMDMATINGRLLFRTYDKGVFYLDATEAALKPAVSGLYSSAVYQLKADSQRMWAVCGNGLFAYDLALQAWDTISRLPIPDPYRYEEIAISPSGTLAVYQLYQDTIYISFDKGDSWQKIAIPSQGAVDDMVWDGESLYVTDIWGFEGNWVTHDYGNTWEEGPIFSRSIVRFNGKYYSAGNELFCASTVAGPWTPVANSPQQAYRLYSSGDRLFCVGLHNDGYALYSSTDGATWQYSNDGLPAWDIWSSVEPWQYQERGGIYFKNGRYILFDRDVRGIFTSLDSCKTWLPVDANSFSTWTISDTTVYVGEYGGGVSKSGLPQQYGALSQGRVFKDDNDNGVYDMGELPLPQTKVSMYEPGAWFPFWYDFTDKNGIYSLGSLPNAADTIRPYPTIQYIDSITPPYHVVTGSASGRDFAVRLIDNITDASVRHYFQGVPRPGFALNGQVSVSNEGTVPLSGKLSLKIDPFFHFASATPPPNEVIGDSLVWDIADLVIFGDSTVYFQGKVDSSALLGSCLALRSTFHSTVVDAAPGDNHFASCEQVRGAFDPNEKSVEPALGLTHADIVAGKELTYTVRFQNTGTWPAERVRITDQLDTALNWQSFRLLDASHPITSMRLMPSGLLELVFDQINLPDSTNNEPSSHGFVRFAIQRKKTYAPSYTIQNKALIFFDFNEPVKTNTVKSPFLLDPVGTKSPVFKGKSDPILKLTPNPAHAQCVVDCGGTLQGKGELLVSDMRGTIKYRQRIDRLELPMVLQTGGWVSGAYWVQLTGAKGRVTGKLLVD